MPGWKIEFTKSAEKDFAKLNISIRQKVAERLEWLIKNFDDVVLRELTGEFRGFYKLRAGDWRVLYDVDWKNNCVVVVKVGHRSKIYKR